MPAAPKNALAFTDRSLKALKPATDRVDYMDRGLEGFGLRVFPSGHKTFFVRYRFGRGFRRFTLGAYPALALRTARALAEDVIGRVARGEDPQADRNEDRAATTFGDLATAYLESHAKRRLRPRSYAEEERVVRYDLLPTWRRLSADKIRRKDVAQLLDGVLARGAAIQANRTRGVALRVFAFGLEREIVEFNPVAGLRRPSIEHSRQRVLTEDEIRSLWDAWRAEESVVSAAFRMLLMTAQRTQEVAGMRWSDIHGAWWTIPAGVVKNKLAHRVYLTKEPLQLLAGLKGITGQEEWVFASSRRPGHPVRWVAKATDRFRAATSIPDWRPHDLRRTAATYMGRLGVSRPAIAKVLNHAESGATAVYDRSTGELEIERALRLWGDRLQEILHGQEPRDNVVGFELDAATQVG